MVVRLVLVCHAATAATRRAVFGADEPLEARARTEAARTAATLGRISGAWCAPAHQCVQTAAALGLTATIDADLRDGDFGRWTGRALIDVHATEPDAIAAWMTDPAAAPHGGESVLDVIARVGRWLDRRTFPDGRTVAVTHPTVIRAAVVHAIAATPASFWRIDIAPLSRTVLSGRSGRWNLQAVHDHHGEEEVELRHLSEGDR